MVQSTEVQPLSDCKGRALRKVQEKAYYVEHYSDHVDGQNERNRKAL